MSDRQQTALIAGERIIYTMRRSRRAQHVLLHVDVEGHVEVVLPWRVAWEYGEKFVQDKGGWIRRHRQKSRNRRRLPVGDGSILALLGESFVLRVVSSVGRKRSSIVQRGGEVIVSVAPQALVRRVLALWYRRRAQAFFELAAKAYAEKLKVRVGCVVVGNHKTQWGSCSARGRLSFNWRLLLGPQWVAEYVAAHEVAHLVHHDHSSTYWATVALVYPDYIRARRWLRDNAEQLLW